MVFCSSFTVISVFNLASRSLPFLSNVDTCAELRLYSLFPLSVDRTRARLRSTARTLIIRHIRLKFRLHRDHLSYLHSLSRIFNRQTAPPAAHAPARLSTLASQQLSSSVAIPFALHALWEPSVDGYKESPLSCFVPAFRTRSCHLASHQRG